MRREATALLARLGHEAIPPRAKVRALRPAAQQIVSIARALSHEARLLIMDEPSAILDEGEIETLFGVVRRLTAEGVGDVYITHRLDEIRRIGDRVSRAVASRRMRRRSMSRFRRGSWPRKIDSATDRSSTRSSSW